jgi:hypothetical protein
MFLVPLQLYTLSCNAPYCQFLLLWVHILICYNYSFETWSSGSTRDLVDPRLELGRVEEKTGERKTRYDPTDPAGWPGDPVDPVKTWWLLFFFKLKRCRFDFKKKKFDRADPVKTRNPGLGPGLKTMVITVFLFTIVFNWKNIYLFKHICWNFGPYQILGIIHILMHYCSIHDSFNIYIHI